MSAFEWEMRSAFLLCKKIKAVNFAFTTFKLIKYEIFNFNHYLNLQSNG